MMQLIRGQHNLSQRLPQGCVLTIGNFDGMHVGHQALLRRLKELSAEYQVPSVLMTFEPQPKEFFVKQQTVARLMRLREKYDYLASQQIDYLCCIKFHDVFSTLSSEDFIAEMLVKQMHVKAIVVGQDFRFGAKRAGDFSLLQQLAQQYGFKVIRFDDVMLGGERVSSTRVRLALEQSDFKQVEALLGRPYSLLGKVAHGDKRGREMGFPTANLFLHRQLAPLSGIYAVQVSGLAATPMNGVAYVGTRPVFHGTRVILEVHLFDFDRDIYGKNIHVEFLHKLREDAQYEGVEKLITQIERDVAAAQEYFL